MLDTLWTILYCIFILSGLLVYWSTFRNWSIKAKIFLNVLDLCLLSVLVVLGFCSNQGLITNLSCIFAILFLLKILKNQLDKLEDETIQKVREAQQQKRSYEQQIIDAEEFTVCN